jgi:hypothetical protein
MRAKRYTLGLLLGVAGLLALAAAVNRLVDPFWYYRGPEIAGFNAVKPRFARFERHVKPQLLARERPQAIVLGSSFAEIGLDANDPALTAGGRLKAYNFAFAGAGWMLVQCHLSYARSVADLERIVVGVHPGPLPAANCSDGLPEVRDFSEAKLLLSLQALNESLRTVLEQRRGRSSHTREGRYLYASDDPRVGARFRERFLGQAQSDPHCTLEAVPASAPQSRDIAPALAGAAGDLDLSGLRAVIRAARASGAGLMLFAYPQHALSLELDLLCGRLAARWEALAAMAQVVAEEAPDGGAQLWTFYGYNAVTGEGIAGRQPSYWQDPEHFTYRMGALMLADMYGGSAVGTIGRRITPDAVADAYRIFLADRDRYLVAHPRFYDELRAALAPLR